MIVFPVSMSAAHGDDWALTTLLVLRLLIGRHVADRSSSSSPWWPSGHACHSRLQTPLGAKCPEPACSAAGHREPWRSSFLVIRFGLVVMLVVGF